MANMTFRKSIVGALAAACVVGSAAADAATVSLVYSFKSGEAESPQAPLLYHNGLLYGTSTLGGPRNAGVVFSVTPGGAEATVHAFNQINGNEAFTPVIAVGDLLCGTTSSGGHHQSSGVLYCVTAAGHETLLHSFNQHKKGVSPNGALLDVGGTLYGTASNGGDQRNGLGNGVVYAFAQDGKLTTPLVFNGADGSEPLSGLIRVGPTLYGTTYLGGKYDSGEVFALTLAGQETVLHDFPFDKSDGNAPVGGLIAVGKTLYGTTDFGGQSGDGTVFKMTLSGDETVLHSFNGADGANPQGGLLDVNGTVYGTTGTGGAYNNGAIFTIAPDGTFNLIYSFPKDGATGAEPIAGLINVNGTLYGTAAGGGLGYGTVYALTP